MNEGFSLEIKKIYGKSSIEFRSGLYDGHFMNFSCFIKFETIPGRHFYNVWNDSSSPLL